LSDDATSVRWIESTRGFLRHVRHFLLFKEGSEPLDSRHMQGLSCSILATAPSRLIEGQTLAIAATVTNTGSAIWLPADAAHGGVQVGAHLFDERGTLLDFNADSRPLTVPPREVKPGETVGVHLALTTRQAGRYTVEVDCVALGVGWFAQSGSRPAVVPIEIVRAE
jgi:hypothetical protein